MTKLKLFKGERMRIKFNSLYKNGIISNANFFLVGPDANYSHLILGDPNSIENSRKAL
jgi:hypothetical protein